MNAVDSCVEDRLAGSTEFRRFVNRVVESRLFGAAMLCIILLNTAILILETDEEINARGGWYFSVVESIFLSIYIVEFMLKWYAMGRLYFKSGWNIVDFVIVLCTTTDFLLQLIMMSVGSFDIDVIFGLFKMSKTIKALRAFRVLRTIRFLKSLQVILTTIFQSFRALSTIVMLQSLFLYMFAVIGRDLFYEVDEVRFGTLGCSFFTLFQLITLDDWYYMYNDVVKKDTSYNYIIIYLVVYIVLENFIFLNLFVAVLVDNFQITLTETEKNRNNNEKHRSLFVQKEEYKEEAATEETREEEIEDEDLHSIDDLDSTLLENESNDLNKKTVIEDFYPEKDIPNKREREFIGELYEYLASLEYNSQQMRIQQRLIDELVDLAINIPDVPEELI